MYLALRNKGTVERSPELGVKLNPTELSSVGPLRVWISVLELDFNYHERNTNSGTK